MLDIVHVDFRYKEDTARITLYSKFTCITSNDSGKGKSEFIAMLSRRIAEETCEVYCDKEYPVTISSIENISPVLKTNERMIVIIDEAITLKSGILQQLIKTPHLYICINRFLPLHGNYPLCGIYTIERTDLWFSIKPFNELPLYSGEIPIDTIITESAANRSEHELLSVYTNKVVASNGSGNVYRQIKQYQYNILVLMDLGNIGTSLQTLLISCENRTNVFFYPYSCFEELLFKSKLIDIEESSIKIRTTDVITTERYYEKILELVTKGTILEYHHKKPLAAPFVDKNNFEKIFNTKVGRHLYYLLQNIDFDPVIYLHNKIGDKVDLLAIAEVKNCKNSKDCDRLIENYKHMWERW